VISVRISIINSELLAAELWPAVQCFPPFFR
jgi:hypothetical protein